MNKTDTFEAIAADAVDLLTAICTDLGRSEEPSDKAMAVLIAEATATFCLRALALGAE
jgi:hypothetical protein